MTNGAIVYVLGVIIGFLAGAVLIFLLFVNHRLLLEEKDYTCIDAEPIDKDPSIVACTIILRKGSNPFKEYLKLNQKNEN